MVLSSTGNGRSILERATFLAFGDTLDHTSAWTLASMVASANEAVQTIADLIWRSSATWQFDDSNQTDLPFATSNLVADQQDYALPTSVFQILGVEVKDANGDWHRLVARDYSEQNLDFLTQGNTAGLPTEYDLVGNSIILDRAPTSATCTLTAGLRITFTREATVFTTPATYTTADNTQPGFDESYHRLIPTMMAYDWAIANGNQEKAGILLQEINTMKANLISHYGKKDADKPFRISRLRERYF